jgi:hypothetical protein
MVERLAGGKAIQLCWEVPNNLPAVRADRAKLSLVLSQILGSTIGGMPGGEIWARTSASDRLALLVGPSKNGSEGAADEGARDAQLNTVGIALARRVVQSIGGDLTIECIPGCGPTFAVTLPTVAAAPTDPPPSPAVTP